MELKAFIGLFLYRGLYKLNKMGTRRLVSDSYGPPMFSAVSLVIVLHLFYTICPLLMKVPALKEGKRTGLLRLVIFLKNSIIIACWSQHLVTIYHQTKLFILCEHRYRPSSSTQVSRRSTTFFSNLQMPPDIPILLFHHHIVENLQRMGDSIILRALPLLFIIQQRYSQLIQVQLAVTFHSIDYTHKSRQLNGSLKNKLHVLRLRN